MAKKGEKINYQFDPYRKEVMKALCLTKLSGRDFRVLLFILGQTDGYHRTEDKIKPVFFAERTGLDKSNIRVTLARLRKLNMIVKHGHFYAVLPPDQWDKEVFVETQMRIDIDALLAEVTGEKRIDIDALLAEVTGEKRIESDAELPPSGEEKRIKSDAPTASNPMHQELKSDAVLASSKEHPSKEHLLKNGSTSDNTGKSKVKPKQPEAGQFITWVSKHEKVPITSPNKLVALARAALVATDGTFEDLQDWYLWVKETDDFWGKKPPPMIIAKVGDMFPTFLRDRKEGRLHDARGNKPGAWRGADPHRGDTLETSRERGWKVTKSGPGEANE